MHFSSVAIATLALALGVTANHDAQTAPVSSLAGLRLQAGAWARIDALPRTLTLVVTDDAGTKGVSTFGQPVAGAWLSTQLVTGTSNQTFINVDCIFTEKTQAQHDAKGHPVCDLHTEVGRGTSNTAGFIVDLSKRHANCVVCNLIFAGSGGQASILPVSTPVVAAASQPTTSSGLAIPGKKAKRDL